MDYALGLDLGGTNIKALAVTAQGEVLQETSVPTQDRGDDRWRENVRLAFREVCSSLGQPPARIGLAAPGLAQPDQRAILAMPGRLCGIVGLVWADYLGVAHDVPVLNDAQAALLGECWLGAARGNTNALLVTLGTGVGGAVLCDGRLLRGHLGRAGHLGHLSLDPDGELDITGCPGSLEDAIGDCTVEARSGGRFSTTTALVQAHLAGDPQASRVWLRSVKALGAALASFVNLFDPQTIVVGGGIARAGAALFDPLTQHLREFEWKVGAHRTQLVPAVLGERAGAFGAARAALDLTRP